MQTIIQISQDAALRLTTHRSYAPSDAAIADGVQPDLLTDTGAEDSLPAATDPVIAVAVQQLPPRAAP